MGNVGGGGGVNLVLVSPPADTVFWKKTGAGPSSTKRGLFPDGFGHRVSKNDVCFVEEGAEVHFLCHRAGREMCPKRKSPFWPINKTPLGALTPGAHARYFPIRAYTKRWGKPMGWWDRPGWQHGLPVARKRCDAAQRGQFDPYRWRYGPPERPS